MAYELHIRRAGELGISLEDWDAYVERAGDLEPRPFLEATNPVTGDAMRIEGPGMAEWTAHPDGAPVLFTHGGGGISAKSPDDPALARMHEIAAAFGAEVRGDDGELYEPDS